jgi:AcrR family transcriptional regulator
MAAAGLRERKKERTRRDLAEAALVLFRDRGFEGTTVDDIAAACEVSARTFFRYFESKDDVLFAGTAEHEVALLAALEARPADEPPLRSLRLAFVAMADVVEQERERSMTVHRIVEATPSLRGRLAGSIAGWEASVVEALARRSPEVPVFRLRVAVAASTAALRVATEEWIDRPRGRRFATILRRAFEELEA